MIRIKKTLIRVLATRNHGSDPTGGQAIVRDLRWVLMTKMTRRLPGQCQVGDKTMGGVIATELVVTAVI